MLADCRAYAHKLDLGAVGMRQQADYAQTSRVDKRLQSNADRAQVAHDFIAVLVEGYDQGFLAAVSRSLDEGATQA